MKKFEQMKRLYTTLTGYIDPFDQSDVVISGTIADFDRLFELSWKTLKEYLYGTLGISEARIQCCILVGLTVITWRKLGG